MKVPPIATSSDDIYYTGAGRVAWQRSLALAARVTIYQAFLRETLPTSTSTILDIGASNVETAEANLLEKSYPYPENITCGVIGDPKELLLAHPKVRIAQITPGAPLPFPDHAFDISYSNAVLEHVGGPDQRRFFISEAMRVSRVVFIAVPNRWFPLEHHTFVPLLHYAPRLFRRALSGTRYDHWSKVENLDFVSAAMLRREWPGNVPPKIAHIGLRLGIFSSNIVAVARTGG
jgi:SAM-dependent methyltransferase